MRRTTAWLGALALAIGVLAPAGPAEAAAPAVTMRFASGASVEAGDPVVVKGTATGVDPGRTVTVQLREDADDPWKPAATGKAAKKGRYTAVFTSTGVGPQQVRAVILAADGSKAVAASSPQTLTVSAWFYLADQPTSKRTKNVTLGPQIADSRKYAHAVTMDPADGPGNDPVLRSASWVVDGACSLLTTRAVWYSRGASGSDAVEVVVDGEAVRTEEVSSAVSVTVRQSTKGGNVLTLTADGKRGGPAGLRMVWGDPQVRCTENPWSDD